MAGRRFGVVCVASAMVGAACSSFSGEPSPAVVTPLPDAATPAPLPDGASAADGGGGSLADAGVDAAPPPLVDLTFPSTCAPLGVKHGLQLTPQADGCQLCWVNNGDGPQYAYVTHPQVGDGGTYTMYMHLAPASATGVASSVPGIRTVDAQGLTVTGGPSPVTSVTKAAIDVTLDLANPKPEGVVEVSVEVQSTSTTCLLLQHLRLTYKP